MSSELPLFTSLPGLAADGFGSLRRRARETFLELGLPDRSNEAYKYTDLTPLGATAWPRAVKGAPAPDLPPALGQRMLWIDGELRESAAGPRAHSLENCLDAPPPALIGLLGNSASADDSLVALNSALFDHGAWIDIADGDCTPTPLELVFVSGARTTPAASHARLAVRVGRGGRLTLIERHLGTPPAALATRVGEITLEAGAELLHVRINEAGTHTWLLGHTAVRADAGAHYRYLGLDFGAKVMRESLRVRLRGHESGTELAGLALLDGRRHADSDVLVEHAATHTRSRQFFRGVLDGRSRSAYTGRVRVAPGAQKTDAGQESANLLLSPLAEADARPQLEIHADDVACSHGAATGAIDPEAMFYLQSRGIGADAAQRMIAFGFAARVLSAVDLAPCYRPLAELLAERMHAAGEVYVCR